MTRITDAVLPRWGRVVLLAWLTLAAVPARTAPAPEVLWTLIAKLAAAAPQGGKAIVQQWPGKPFSLAGAASADSAPISLGPGLQTAIAEVRLSDGDSVRLMVLRLQGNCITPADVGARYQQLRNDSFPQPNNPDPVSYRSVDIDGVKVSFGFRGAGAGCLSHVVFNPQGD